MATIDLLIWMGYSSIVLNLNKEEQVTKESGKLEEVIPPEEHTNWLSNMKWPAMKTYIQIT